MDALDTSLINILPGGKKYYTVRNGTYRYTQGEYVQQSMQFAEGDVLLVSVSIRTELSTAEKQFHSSAAHSPGEIISVNHELFGAAKGSRQILLERGREITLRVGCRRDKYRKSKTSERKAALKASHKLQFTIRLP